MTVVILTAVVPTLIAQSFFEPHALDRQELEEVDAAEEIDAAVVPHPRLEQED